MKRYGIRYVGKLALAHPEGRRTYRVLVAKLGLDGHDRGARVIIRALRDAGFDVIYSGLHRSPDSVVGAALDEDVDVLGVSLLSGAHLPLVRRLASLLDEEDAGDIPVVVGGLIPAEDHDELLALGVRAIFDQDMPLPDVIEAVRHIAARSRTSRVGSQDGH